jgi:acyl-CoA synthetase (AMP-forming)/AMP-acid ligase II
LNYHFLQAWAEEDRPHHLFLEFSGAAWTYKQFYLEVQRVGNWLMNDLKIERNEVVALDGGNSCSYMLLWFALEGIGACPAFINSNLTSDSLQHCVNVSGSTQTPSRPSADRMAVGWFKVPSGGESH